MQLVPRLDLIRYLTDMLITVLVLIAAWKGFHQPRTAALFVEMLS